MTGLQHLCGLPDREPTGTGTNYPDHVPNPCHAAFAVLAALRHRRRTGQGQCIDMAQTEPTIALLGPAVMAWTANGQVLTRRGNQHLDAAPHGVYPCAGQDRWIAIAVTSDAAWEGVCEVLGRPAWCMDPVWGSLASRRARSGELDELLALATATWDAETLMSELQSRGVAAGVVRDVGDLMLNDRQLQHRRHWVSLDHPEMGRSVYNAPAYRLSGLESGPLTAAPLLGEHTEQVCGELLGLSSAQVRDLQARGVLR